MKRPTQQDSHRFCHERAARCPPPFFAAWAATRGLKSMHPTNFLATPVLLPAHPWAWPTYYTLLHRREEAGGTGRAGGRDNVAGLVAGRRPPSHLKWVPPGCCLAGRQGDRGGGEALPAGSALPEAARIPPFSEPRARESRVLGPGMRFQPRGFYLYLETRPDSPGEPGMQPRSWGLARFPDCTGALGFMPPTFSAFGGYWVPGLHCVRGHALPTCTGVQDPPP